MKTNKIIALCQGLEQRLDRHLFGVVRDPATGQYLREDGTPATVDDFKTVGGAVKTAAVVGGGVAAGVGARAGLQAARGRYGAGNVVSGVKADLANKGTAAVAGAKDALAAAKTALVKRRPMLGRIGRAVGAKIGLRFDAKQPLLKLAAKHAPASK